MTRLIRENDLRIIDPQNGLDNTQRVLTFAKWLQGMSHIHLGMLFDSAAVITEREDLSKIPDDEITGLEIPTGQPLVYELGDDLKPSDSYYLNER